MTNHSELIVKNQFKTFLDECFFLDREHIVLFVRHLQPVLVEYLAESELLRREDSITLLFADPEQQEVLLVPCMIVEWTHVELTTVLFEDE